MATNGAGAVKVFSDGDRRVTLFSCGQAGVAFDNGRHSKAVEDGKERKIEQLEAKLTRKNEVVAELMEALRAPRFRLLEGTTRGFCHERARAV